MRLHSDFEDYYDAALRLHQAEGLLIRKRFGSMSRRESFEYLHQMGWPTVPCGTVQELQSHFGDEVRLVIYRDEFQHGVDANGEDPLLVLNSAQAAEEMPSAFASLYLPFLDGKMRALSMTMLFIGHRCFLLQSRQAEPIASSAIAWASNRGSFRTSVIRQLSTDGFDLRQEPQVPVWSVDYVMAAHQGDGMPVPTAFDMNMAPVLRGTGIEQYLSPETVADLIVRTVNQYRREKNGRMIETAPESRIAVIDVEESAVKHHTEEAMSSDEESAESG